MDEASSSEDDSESDAEYYHTLSDQLLGQKVSFDQQSSVESRKHYLLTRIKEPLSAKDLPSTERYKTRPWSLLSQAAMQSMIEKGNDDRINSYKQRRSLRLVDPSDRSFVGLSGEGSFMDELRRHVEHRSSGSYIVVPQPADEPREAKESKGWEETKNQQENQDKWDREKMDSEYGDKNSSAQGNSAQGDYVDKHDKSAKK